VVQCGAGYGLTACPALGVIATSNYTDCTITLFQLEAPYRLIVVLGNGRGT
jgi:hypothetical protein